MTVEITGRIIDSQTGEGVRELRVELRALEITLEQPFLIMDTTTDGYFMGEVDEQHLDEIGWSPLYFRVLRGDQVLTSTEETLLVRFDDLPTEIVIEVDLPAIETQPTIPVIDFPFEPPMIELPPDRPVIDLPRRPLDELAMVMDSPPALLERLAARQIKNMSDILAAGGLHDIEGIPADDPAVARLEAHAKLSLLVPDVRVNERLIDEGFASPAAIARTPQDRFIAQLSPVLDEQAATQVHASAEVQYRLLNHAAANQMIATASAPESLRAAHMQPCECKDCQSAVSPGAYLADLMDYVLTHLQFYWPGFPAPNPMNLDYLIDLFYQPFDKLPVSCESADEQVRQVRICIEVLRKFLGDQADLLPNNPTPSYPIKFAFEGDVDGDGRDEVIIAPDWTATATEAFNRQESSALWVMDYDPAGKFWRHLSPVNGHPYEADVVCGPYPYEAKFGFAADVDGDGWDEIILGIGKPGETLNEFWVMKYTAGGQWQHLSPIPGQAFNADLDPSGAAVGSRFAAAADVDGDNRAEIIIALDRPGAEGRLFWVMDFNPLTNQWSHLSAIQNHPLNADLDPMPDLPAAQVQAEFLVVGDFDGDGRDELVINLKQQNNPVTGRFFWILDYDPTLNPPQWTHLRQGDGDVFGAAYSLPIPVAARFGTASDIDNDGRDELLIGIEPYLVPGADPNAIWVVDYAYFGEPYFSWLWQDLYTINCSSGPTHAQAAIVVDSEGTAPMELAVLPIFEQSSPDRNNPQNGLWIMQFDANANQWRHQSPIANHSLDADLDWSKVVYPANAIFAADVDGDGRDEIVVYPAPRQALWVMKYDSIADAWQHFSPGVNLAQALDRYLLAAYRMLLSEMGTSAEEVRLAHAAQEEDRKALAERLGIDLGTARPDNLDALILYESTLTEQGLETLFGLVDTTREPFSTIPASKMQTWRLANLYQSWENQDGLSDDYATHKLPIIDPDIVTPDDFRVFDAASLDTPAALWLKRRQWVDALLDDFRALTMNVQIDGQGVDVPDLDAMLEMLRLQPVTYEGQQQVVWSQLGAIADLDTLYINITEKDKESAETATTFLREQLFLTVDSFTRLMVIRKKMEAWVDETSDDEVTDDEWEEIYSILAYAVKVALFEVWIGEEDVWENPPGQPKRSLFSPKYFWIPLRAPKEGSWSSALVKPFVDPAVLTLTDLPDSKVGTRAVELWTERQEELSELTQALQVEYNTNGFEALLVMAFGPPAQPPTTWNERLRELKDSLDTGDSAQVEPARAYIEQQLYLSLDQFNRLVNGRAKLDAGKKPTQPEWMQIYALLTGALKKRVQYPQWTLVETNGGLQYWQALKARLPRWRSTPEARQGWQQALIARSQPPIIEPDIITLAYVHNDGANVKQIYGQRQNAITTRRNLLKNQAQDLNGLQGMLLLEDSFGVTNAELATLIKQYADGEIAVERLDQIGISRGAFAAVSRVYQMLRDNTPVFEDEWESVYDILTQVWKQRQFADWRDEEIASKLSLSPLFFQLPKRDPTLFPPSPPPELPLWRATRRALRDWTDTLESRIEQEETVKEGLRVIISEVEEATLPMLRDALVLASTVPVGTLAGKAKWLSDRLMIDTQSDGCRITTRVAQTLETLQTLLWSARTGQLEGLDNLELFAPYFDEEWKWIGSYATWRAAVFVYLYPENIAQPSLRRWQTPVFRKLTQDLRANRRLTPAQARQLVATYAAYWRDVCNLEIKACAHANTRVYFERNGRPQVGYADKLYLFGISLVTGKTYWSTQDSYSDPGYRQSYWQELEGLSAVTDLIGAIPYRTPTGSRFLCLFVRTRDDAGQKLALIRYDLENPNWESEPKPLEVPDKAANFEAKLKETAEGTPPYLAITLPNGVIYARSLNAVGTDWESTDFQPIYTYIKPLSWGAPNAVTIPFSDIGRLGDITIADLDGNGRPELVALRLDERQTGDGTNTYPYFSIGWNVNSLGNPTHWTDVGGSPIGGGPSMSGSGITAANINNNNNPDLILYRAYSSPNLGGMTIAGVYQVGFDIQTPRVNWSPLKYVPLLPFFLQGSGITTADISGSGRPDLIIFSIFHIKDNEGKEENHAAYQIGWNLDTAGNVESWSHIKQIPGWFGASNQGGGIAVADLNGNGHLDLIVFHIDHPEGGNHGYYRIGWNLSASGDPLAWSDVRPIPDWFGNENLDGGIAVTDLDGNGLPELVVYHIDNPAGVNTGYYRIGWNLDGEWNQNWRQPCPYPIADFKPLYAGPYDIDERVSQGLLQSRRTDIESAFQTNQALDARYRQTHLTYLEEAFYFVPISIALQLQRVGEYTAALDWFRTVYDYTAALDKRKIYYGLKREEQIQLPDYPNRVDDWLLDPLNPHLIANSRRNTYTRFTLLSLVRCFLDAADAEFTRDTAESIPRARILYTTALELLDAPELKQQETGCAAVIGRIEKTFDFWHEVPIEWQPVWNRLMADVRSLDSLPTLEAVNAEAQAVQGRRMPIEEALTHLEQFVVHQREAVAALPSPTLSLVLTERPHQIERAQQLALTNLPMVSRLSAAAGGGIVPLPFEPSSEWVPTITYDFCVVPNPVLSGLRLRGELNLYKIRTCRNIAGMERQVDPYAAPTDTQTGLPTIGAGGQLILPGTASLRPTPYRYPVLIERAKQLNTLAQQVESAFLTSLQMRDQEAYTLFKARQELGLARAGVRLQDMRVKEAESGIKLAELQTRRAEIQLETYQEWIDEGLLAIEEAMVALYIVIGVLEATAAIAGAVNDYFQLTAVKPAVVVRGTAQAGAAAAQAALNVVGVYASYERRKQEWELQKNLADQDILIGGQQIQIAEDHLRVVGQERAIAEIQADNAEATINFLNNKFTNAELYDWMSGILEGVYRFFLQQATAMALLAGDAVAFERGEPPPPYIQTDYWQAPNDGGDSTGPGPDRRGLTGSVRLLQDIYQLDQYAFDTNQRKLQLSKTISLVRLSPVEFQRFRETGVFVFKTPMSLFDRDFPGHYLRLIHKVRTSVIALIPPTQGIRATLTTGGVSRVVIGGDIFQSMVVRRDPQAVALSSPGNSTGLFELDPQSEMLMPFEGLGVDTTWEFRMPKAANLFDYNTIADVLITIEYTALNSFTYRQQIIQQFDTRLSADQPFSLRNRFMDAWYDLNNAELVDEPDQMVVRFITQSADFPPNLENLKIQHVALYIARKSGTDFEIPIGLYQREQNKNTGRLGARVGGSAATVGGLISTRRGNAGSWMAMINRAPIGEWELALPNTQEVQDRFKNEEIDDVLLVITYAAETPSWPS